MYISIATNTKSFATMNMLFFAYTHNIETACLKHH